MAVSIKTLDGATTTIEQDTIDGLTASVRGDVLQSDTPGYDDTRSIWNAMIDRRPGMILRCAGTADVIRGVNFARENNLLVSVRGAGHNIAGNAVTDGGFMIDLAGMTSIRVDVQKGTARVEPGCTLGDVDNETQQYGLATPVGINSTTGIAGLTLGGGFGWLSRKYGLTCDNLISADVVTASGELVHANADENTDLFWGIRGGGGNFGVVTSFEFKLHPVGPEVLSGLIVHPFSDARKVLQFWRDFCAEAPDDLSVWAVLRKAPPLPFLPEEVHGTEVLVLATLYAGAMSEGEAALKPLREFGNPIADVVSPHPFTGFQQAFDPLLTPGLRNYWKSHDFLAVEDGLIDTLLEAVGNLPSPHTEVFIGQLGGATKRVAAEATAYFHRDAEFVMNVHGRWEAPEDDEMVIGWSRELFNATTQFATGGVYVNFMTEEETDRISEAYGSVYQKLVELKKKYDPKNIFRMNQNIKPE